MLHPGFAMRLLPCAFFFASAAGLTWAQTPVAPKMGTKDADKDKAKDKPKGDKPTKLPPSPLDKVEGYKRQIIGGFTVMVSPEAAEGEILDGELKPLDALAGEFQVMKKVMPAKHVELLQKVVVWVDWDEYQAMGNGREGRALGVYETGTAQSLTADKKNPYTAKCVHIYSLKLLAEQHQPKRDSHRLVLLHEFAHAVHDQLLGFDHSGIKAAYKQAVERKLYDPAQYVSTNEKEFFAELTCAYYDQLHHYPKIRDELKKHDPVTHQLLDSIWGTAKKPFKATAIAAKPKALAESNGSDKFDHKISLGEIQLGTVIHGPEFKIEDAKGAILILSNFGGDELIVLEKLARMHDELSPYGARVAVAHAFVAEPEAIKKKLEDRGIAYTGFDKALIPARDGKPKAETPGHTLIFDETGKCVFRGSGYDAMPHARAAVANMLVAKSIPGETPKAFAAVVELLKQGAVPILDSIPKIGAFVGSSDPEVSAAAKALATAIIAPGLALLIEAQGQAKSDPYAALTIAEKIAVAYKGTSIVAKSGALIEQLKLNPIIAKELKARKVYDPIKKLDDYLMAQPGSFRPLDDKFGKDNRAAIEQLLQLNAQLKKSHPMARCTQDAAKIVAKYSLGE